MSQPLTTNQQLTQTQTQTQAQQEHSNSASPSPSPPPQSPSPSPSTSNQFNQQLHHHRQLQADIHQQPLQPQSNQERSQPSVAYRYRPLHHLQPQTQTTTITTTTTTMSTHRTNRNTSSSCPPSNPTPQTQPPSSTRSSSQSTPQTIGGPSATRNASPQTSADLMPRGLDDYVIPIPPAANRPENPKDPASKYRHQRRQKPQRTERSFGSGDSGDLYGELRSYRNGRWTGWPSSSDEKLAPKDEELTGKTDQQEHQQQEGEQEESQTNSWSSPQKPHANMKHPSHLRKSPPTQSPLSRGQTTWTWGQPQDTPNS